jgi:internalin A
MSNRPGYLDHLSPMQRLWFIFGTMVSLVSAIPAPGKQTPNTHKMQSFTQWCQQKESVPAAAKKTIEVLLKQAKTNDCAMANAKLQQLTTLDLNWSQISNIEPLAAFTNLKDLNLERNDISDIKPLANLTNLTELNLRINNVSNIKPLHKLKFLSKLSLGFNQISNVTPLAKLTNLTYLDISNNQIINIKSLSSLTKLTELRLGGNGIEEGNCPIKPKMACNYYIQAPSM